MPTIRIRNGFLTLGKTDFKCPYCNKEYDDIDGIYKNRCNKNITGITRISCSCKNTFYMTYCITGKAISFKK